MFDEIDKNQKWYWPAILAWIVAMVLFVPLLALIVFVIIWMLFW